MDTGNNININISKINDYIFNNDIINKLSIVAKAEDMCLSIPYLTYDNIIKPDINNVNISTKIKTLILNDERIKCISSIETLQDINRISDINDDEFIDFVSYDTKTKILRDIISLINKYGEQSYLDTWSKYDLRKKKHADFTSKYLMLLHKLFPKTFHIKYRKEYLIKDDVDVKVISRQILTKILMHSNMLLQTSRILYGDLIITNIKIANLLSNLGDFVVNTNINFDFNNPYFYGSVHGIDIIVDPKQDYNDDYVLMMIQPKTSKVSFDYITTVYNPKYTSIISITESNAIPAVFTKTAHIVDFSNDESFAKKCFTKMYFNIENK